MSALRAIERQGSELRFAGYAALYANRDAGGDLILPGAFANSLASKHAPIPLLWEHRPEMQIGVIDQIGEDERGLRVIGRITLFESRPAQQVRSGQLSGLSFGYRARKFRTVERGRNLASIDLFEVSLVANPLQHGARIHMIA